LHNKYGFIDRGVGALRISSFKTFIGTLALITSMMTPAVADGGVEDLERLLNEKNTKNLKLEKSKTDLARVQKHDGALRLTSNKNELIRLDKDAASVIINNPQHVNIMLDSPRLLIVMPRDPGTTSFTVLDAKGQVVLEKDVIVTNTQPQYVRVRRMCTPMDASCVPTAYYYCPDGCYEVTPVQNQGIGEVFAPPPAGAGAAALNAAQAASSLAGGRATAPSNQGTAPPAAAEAESAPAVDEFNPIGSNGEPTGEPPPAVIVK
jgi:hypothetical protein